MNPSHVALACSVWCGLCLAFGALGALADPGLNITTQYRSFGLVSGTRGALTVPATVRLHGDGTPREEFSRAPILHRGRG